jgi:ATP-dependent DNA helicase RecG
MTATVEQIDLWMQSYTEHENLEFKEAKNQFDNERLFSYCVAIANEGGGVLLLGVANTPPRAVVGSSAFNNPTGIAQKIFEKLGFRVDVHAVEHPDGRVVVFTIPCRPRGTAYHLDGKYLMRAGEALVPMSEDRLRRIFDEGRPEWFSEPATGSIPSEDVVERIDTQAYFELIRLPYPPTRDAVIDRLLRDRIIERTGTGFMISNLGALLFARRLEDFGSLGRKAPRVIVYDGVGKARTKRDQPGTKGYAVGFSGLVDFVMSQIPTNEVISEALRRETPMFPLIMIREAVANALIHQDLSVTGASVMVEIFDDRVEVSNPGQPTVKVDRFIDEYQSRNERMADVMRRIGVCEEKGSGIDKIVDAAEAFQLPAPDFRADTVRTTCVLYGHQQFALMTREDRIRACYQHCVLRFVTNAVMTNESLRKRFGLPDEKAESVSRILRDTVDAGHIQLQDADSKSKRFARYVPYWA